MHKEFCITDIILSLCNKTITLKANFKIDEKSVNLNTVKLKDALTGRLEDYELEVKGYEIIITFRDWPKQNYEYSITVSNEVKDKLERPLISSINKTIIFESQVKYKADIIKPKKTETLKGSDIIIEITTTPEDESINKEYNYQIATDNAFCHIIHDFTTDKQEALFSFNEDGQYFSRARVIEKGVFGEWSQTIDFIIIETNQNNDTDQENNVDKIEEENLSPFLEDMLSMDTVLMDEKPLEIISIESNGETSESMIIHFNQDLEEIPTYVLMLRRDL